MSDAITPTPTLEEVTHAQSNELFDVVALLSAAEGRIDESTEQGHNTLRLVQMAREKVRSVIDAFTPHI